MIIYSKEYYIRRLNELKDCNNDLEKCIKNLNELLNEIKDFSFDKHTEDNKAYLRSVIKKTESVRVRTQKMITLYTQTITDLDFADETITTGSGIIAGILGAIIAL